MQDITINGAAFEQVPAIIVPKTGGGSASFLDTSDASAIAAEIKSGKTAYVNGAKLTGTYLFDWMGDNAEKVSDVYSAQFALSGTSFSTWTPATTAKSIKSAVTATTFAADLSQYEYLLRWKYDFTAAYPDGTSMVSAPLRELAVIHQVIFKRPNSLANIEGNNWAGNTCVTLYTAPFLKYHNASGTLTYTFSISNGIYPAATAATFSNSTSNTPTVTVKTPSVSAKCHDTYFSTATAGVIDQANSKFIIKGELFRFNVGSHLRSMYQTLIDIYNSPLTTS